MNQFAILYEGRFTTPSVQLSTASHTKFRTLPAGLIINFNEPTLTAGVRRLDHPAIYARKRQVSPEPSQER